MSPVGGRRQLFLEGVDLRAERGDPSPLEGPIDRSLVGQPGVRG
jgi:hypothetical protein